MENTEFCPPHLLLISLAKGLSVLNLSENQPLTFLIFSSKYLFPILSVFPLVFVMVFLLLNMDLLSGGKISRQAHIQSSKDVILLIKLKTAYVIKHLRNNYRWCVGSECSYPPKFICWSPRLRCDGVGRRGLRDVIMCGWGPEDGASGWDLCSYKARKSDLLLHLPHEPRTAAEPQWEGSRPSAGGPSPELNCAGPLIWTPSLRDWEKMHASWLSHLLHGFCFSSLSRLGLGHETTEKGDKGRMSPGLKVIITLSGGSKEIKWGRCR